ncbi:MAG: glycosyltransferase family 39 protein [Acidobacteria bacterium]|nr:glycosyltransferase family 39 protein [Acidobacteriota bacterium]
MSEAPAVSPPADFHSARFPFLFYLVVAAALALLFTWAAAEKGPTRWDDSWYLASSLRLFDRFAEQGLAAYWKGFQHALGDKAPLITVLPLPFFCLLGRSTFVLYLVNAVALIVVSAALYRFCRKFFSERISLLALFLALTSPMLAGLSRLYLPEYWLTALVVSACLVLAEWERTGRNRLLLWLGVVCGLGLLMKITFPLFVGPVVAVILVRARGRRIGRLVADVALIAAPAIILAGPWYYHNWEAVTRRSFQESYFMPVHPVERQSPVGMAVDYFFMFANHGVSAIHLLVGAAGLVFWAAVRRDNFLRGALAYVVPWVATLPVFALSDNRDVRLIAPILPAFALVAAALFDGLLERWPILRRPLLAAVAGGTSLILLGNSFPIFGSRTMGLGRWSIFSPATAYAFPPNPQHWPLGEALQRIAHRERIGPGSKLIIGLGADTWSFNSNDLDLEAALLKYPFEFYTTAYTADTDQIHKIMSGVQYFLFKDGGTQKPPDRFRSGPRTIDFLLHGPLFREVQPGIEAPDGGRIRIFENTADGGPDAFFPARQGAPPLSLDKVDLNFGNYLQVTDLKFSEREGLFNLGLRWRCRNPPPAPLRCFAHIVDAQGSLLGSLDHEILHGSPPVSEWQPGDEGQETRHLILRAATAKGTQLRLGLFDPETRLRVPVWASTLPLKDDYTAAVVISNAGPTAVYTFKMAPAPVVDCDVAFEGGLRLTGYSLRRAGEVAWLRLRWEAPRPASAQLRFFGHAVADQPSETPILLSFDQDIGLDKLAPPPRGSPLVVIQDVVRDISKLSAQARLLRAGVFDIAQPLDRLKILSSSLPMDGKQKAIFLPLPAAEQPPAPAAR